MDYTDLTQVKNAMDSQETVKDTVLSDYISKASRLIDRLCVGRPDAVDYFKLENVVNEFVTNGVVDFLGRLTVYPHKCHPSAVQALSYKYTLADPYITADLGNVITEDEGVLFEGGVFSADRIYALISYTGGLGASVSDLPKDLQDAATVLAVRLYKEARSGLGDSIGVAELGILVYTKAFPVRVIETLQSYARLAPWT
jgi:hypothetical protein